MTDRDCPFCEGKTGYGQHTADCPIKKAVDEAPPLTEQQIAILARLLSSGQNEAPGEGV